MARSRSRAQSSESREPNAIAMIRHRNAMRAEVRFRWSQEVIAGNKLIRGGMETEPCDNSSISFRQAPAEIAQRRCASKQTCLFRLMPGYSFLAMKTRSPRQANRAMTLIEVLL